MSEDRRAQLCQDLRSGGHPVSEDTEKPVRRLEREKKRGPAEWFECTPGDVMHVPNGTRHIHRAMPGHDAVHIAITHGDAIWETDPEYPQD